MTVITDGPERRAWQALGRTLPRPRAILVISAHWQTRGRTHVTAEPNPRTIHDFGGFPDELFDIRYPAPGSADLVERVAALLGEERIERDITWGFDHGAWGVVQPMFPQADIPMVAMSLDRKLDPVGHLMLGASASTAARRRRPDHRQRQYHPQSSALSPVGGHPARLGARFPGAQQCGDPVGRS